MSGEHQGASGKERGPKPGAATRRAQALVLLAQGWPQERVAAEVGLSVKTIQNLASAHGESLLEVADAKVDGLKEGAAQARAELAAMAPKAVDVVRALMTAEIGKNEAPGAAVNLRAAMTVLDRGGVPVLNKLEHSARPPDDAAIERLRLLLVAT